MSAVEKAEAAIRQFSVKELDEFSRWFESYLADKWDKELERDAAAGKLDKIAAQALDEHRAGRAKSFP